MARHGDGPAKLVLAMLAAGLYAGAAFLRESRPGTVAGGPARARRRARRRGLSREEARLVELAPQYIQGSGVPSRPGPDDHPAPRADRPGHGGELPPGELDEEQPAFKETPAEALARGRGAAFPQEIPALGWKDILMRTWQAMNRDHLSLIAAGVAFYGLLAIFPAIGVTVAVAGLFTTPSDFLGQISAVSAILPQAAAEILIGQATAVAGADTGGLGLAAVVGLLIAFYSASRGVANLIQGLNVAYGEREKRGMVQQYLISFGLTLVIIVGAMLGLTATIVIPAVLGVVGLSGIVAGWIAVLRWPILLVGTIFGLGILYRFGPSRAAARMSWLSPGALLACGLWLIGTAGFAWYAGHFGSYNQTFGALGGAIVLLMWLWLSAYIVLIGAELNGEIEAQTIRDSTTGREKPMGQRGAVKADVLGPPA